MIKRLLAITSDHKVDEFNKGIINEDFYIKARDKIQDNDSYIKSGSISIEELKAVTLNSLDPNKINIVFVDHIGLLETEDRNFSRNEYDKVTHCMKELRNLALDNNLIIFVASQFDRASIKTNNISMSSLKSSGEIENSSTHVLLLKESKQRETPEDKKKYYQEVTIEIAKKRNGEVRELDNNTFLKTKQIFRESQRKVKMIKVEEIVEKYKGYEVDEEKLKEFLVPPKPKTIWDLKIKDDYWCISDYDGNVRSTWDNCTIDNYRRSTGNCFLTEKEAKFQVERRKVEAILLKYGGRRFKNSERNYYLYYDHEDNLIRKNMVDTCQSQGIIFFDDDKVIDQAIKEAGEDNIKKYIFGVDAK